MLARFDFDPEDKFYKVKAEHAFDFMKRWNTRQKSATLLYPMPSMAWKRYESTMNFTAEQR